jgi:hypothetical protein
MKANPGVGEASNANNADANTTKGITVQEKNLRM